VARRRLPNAPHDPASFAQPADRAGGPLARMRQGKMPAWLCRLVSAGSALAVLLAMSWLYRQGRREVYDGILQSWV
jgi:hypothetical protein